MGKLSKGKKKVLIIASLLVTVVVVGIFLLIVSNQRQMNIDRAAYIMASETNKLQYAIDSRLLTAETLEMLVINNGGNVENFDYVAEILYEDDEALRSLQLAPNGVVTYVYPLEGNEGAFIDLFSEPLQKKEAEWARDTGKMTLAGPFELKQGGMGLVARNPIYLEEKDGTKTFWGFSTVVLNVPEIFDKADLNLLTEQNYHYRIWREDPNTKGELIIAENTGKAFKEPLKNDIKVPNGTWHFSIVPKQGWIPLWALAVEGSVTLIIVVLSILAMIGFMTVLQQKGELVHQNNTDSLTGIRNGRYFMHEIKAYAKEGIPFALFYLDMNNFKQINDIYGHDVGDKVLKEVAVRIKGCIRERDIAARIGGDEFTVMIINEKVEEDCANMKERLHKKVSQPFRIGKINFYPEISVGYAMFPSDGDEIEKVMRLADQRMYEEKRKIKQEKMPNDRGR